jgi:DNA-binding NtrC family response regulator
MLPQRLEGRPFPLPPRAHNNHMKILVVDDNEDLHFILAIWLAKAGGYDLHFATNGDEALEQYERNEPYDVVLTDFVHPGLNGLELAKAMRRKNPKQGVAMFTAGMSASAVRSCRRLKIPVLWKPCFGEDLLPVLKAAMATKKLPTKTVQSRSPKKGRK